MTQFEIFKAVHFEAAHFLPMGDSARGHRRLHGHSFKLEVALRGERSEGQAWVEDLDRLTAALDDLRKTLDHHWCMNKSDEHSIGDMSVRYIFAHFLLVTDICTNSY